jgi:hypothetical protein
MSKEMGLAESALAPKPKKDKPKSKKSIKRISHTAAHSGGYVVKHEHHGSSHPDETHLAADKAALMAHMQANTPEPDPQGNQGDQAEPQPAGPDAGPDQAPPAVA